MCACMYVCYFACSMLACDAVRLSLESIKGNLLTYLYSLQMTAQLSQCVMGHRVWTALQSCLPVEYPNSLTLCGLPKHKLNINLGAPVILLCST